MKFAEYVRSNAFSLNLSPRMITVLLSLCGKGPCDNQLNLHPYQALHRRGLVDFTDGSGFTPTEAGRKVSELLVIAGYTTND